MAATMIMTTPPRINNTLDKEERARLVRSTRKLGAVLGTTPLLVEVEAKPARTQKDKIKREGRLFSHSASSSLSSFGTSSSATVVSDTRPSLDGDYVLVRRNGPSAPYQVQAVFDNASPPSSRSASPMRGVGPSLTEGGSTNVAAVSRKRKQSQNQKQPDVALELLPRNMLFPATSGSATHSQGTGSGSGSGSKHRLNAASVTQTHQPYPTQPLLLRLRSAPISTNTDGDINVMDVDSDKASIITTTTIQPLSPASSTFNMSLLTIDPFVAADYSRSKALSDKEKRRKMAKLARTLGENVPPELVFRPSNTSSTSSSSSHATTRRRASLSIKPYFTTKAPTLPPLAVAEAPCPISDFTQSSTNEEPTKRPSKPLSRPRPRPASLALGSASAFVAVNNALSQRKQRDARVIEPTRGTNSLDIQRQQQQYYRPAHLLPLGVNTKPVPPSPRPFLTVAAPISSSSSSLSNSDSSDDDSEDEVRRAKSARPGLTVEWGRRKEREWSGEWNMRDMEDVAMKLRCLKGR